jgi:hypothetical protein
MGHSGRGPYGSSDDRRAEGDVWSAVSIQAAKLPPRVMTLQYHPELKHSAWTDTYLSDEDGCELSYDELVVRLRQGVLDGEWVAWRLIHIEYEEVGNVT